MTVKIAIASILLATSCINATNAQAAIKHSVDIPAQELGTALVTLAKQTHLQLVYSSDLVAGRNSRNLSGSMTPDEALDKLLARTGLKHEFIDSQTVALFARSSQTRASNPSSATTSAEAGSVWQRFRLAQASNVASESTASGGETSARVEEIIVTAQKRGNERLQDVPIPVTVLNTDRLAANGQVRIRDYYNTVPGFAMVGNYGFRQNLAIRGITTGGFTNPTVAIVVDDVAYGASTSNSGSNDVPDIDPGDLARIEVLRGPQGTIYGASSMGGLVRYVTKDPSFDAVSGRLEVGSHWVRNGGDTGVSVRGSINVPVSETLAMRVSAFTRDDPGYIDNPVAGLDGVDSISARGGRISGLWKPSDIATIKFSALYQRTEADGVPDAFIPTADAPETFGLGDLDQSYMPGTGASDREVHAYSLTGEFDFGWSTLTSTTGYNVNKFANFYDRSAGVRPLLGAAIMRDFGVTGIVGNDNNNIKKFSQEVRLASPTDRQIEWLAGGYYTREDSKVIQRYFGADQVTGRVLGEEWRRDLPYLLEEISGFATLTYHFTDRFDVQAGGRYSKNKEHDDPYIQTGLFVNSVPVTTPALESSANTFTHLLTARYKVWPNVMAYGRWASGYRAGGPNFITPGGTPSYAPDKTQNYEIGFKGDFLDGALSIDTSVYYIDWKDIQISLRTPQSITYLTNGSRAKSEGVEFSMTARPFTGFTVAGWLAYNDAVLTEPLPSGGTAYGVEGDRLPGSARKSGHLSLEQTFPIGSRMNGFVGASATYTGDRVSLFTPTPVRQLYPSYSRVDFRTGLQFDSWTASLYVNNVTDERGVLAGGLSYQPTYAYLYIQPRTIGLSIAKTY